MENTEDDVTIHSAKPESTFFNPTSEIKLAIVEEFTSFASINDMVVADLLNDSSPQIYLATGKGFRSSFSQLKPGINIEELSNTEFPVQFSGCWALKSDFNDQFDKFIVLSSSDSTIILKIDDNINECIDSGFDGGKPTIFAACLVDSSRIQIVPDGVVHVRADGKTIFLKISTRVVCADCSERQVVLGLEEGEIIYFELETDGKLYQKESKAYDAEVVCLSVSPIFKGRLRSKFLAVGYQDKTIRILSLDPESRLVRLSMQALPSLPTSVCLTGQLEVSIGCFDGSHLKSPVDDLTGAFGESTRKALGIDPVQLTKCTISGEIAVLCNSQKLFLNYKYNDKLFMSKVDYDDLTCVVGLNVAIGGLTNIVVAVYKNNMKFLAFSKLGEVFSYKSIDCRYTPRKVVCDENNLVAIVIEADPSTYNNRKKELIRKEVAVKTKDDSYLDVNERLVGYPRAREDNWGSCVRVIDPFLMETVDLIELEENEAALSAVIMTFTSYSNESYLVLGTVKVFF